MRKYGWTAILLIAAVLLAGFLLPDGEASWELSEGRYTMGAGHEEMVISLDLDDERFAISNDGGRTWYLTGTFRLDGQIVATTDDGENTYVFDIVDNEKIRYVYRGDSEIVTGDGETMLYNGATFRYDE